jgi:hypothetical protein
MHDTIKPTGRCKHGMIQEQCALCNGQKPITTPLAKKPIYGHSIKPIVKPDIKENTMKKENPICCVHNCDAKSRSHGLCDKHLYQWQKGKIQLHPEKHITWEEHKQEPEFKNRSAARKKREEKRIHIADKIQTLTANLSVLSLLRTKLKECLPVVQTLDMLGMKDKAKKEVVDILGSEWFEEGG